MPHARCYSIGVSSRRGCRPYSIAKALKKNPRCHTIYLASVFTESVLRQIRDDGQVRDVFNLTAILAYVAERERFLKKLFHIVNTPI